MQENGFFDFNPINHSLKPTQTITLRARSRGDHETRLPNPKALDTEKLLVSC